MSSTPGNSGLPGEARRDAEGSRLAARVSQWFPMSSGQRRLWLLDQLDLAGAAYNQVVCLRLEGDLVLRALERALHSLIVRHEVFRTTFGERDALPCQRVDAPWQPRLQTEDLSPFAAAERESRLDGLVAAEIAKPFDLAAGQLLRIRLYRVDTDEHVLLLVTHHICFDGWSRGVLVRDLERAYNAATQSRADPAQALEWQYGDFARWEQERLDSRRIGAELSRWRERLQGLESLVLPTDRPRTTTRSQGGAHRQLGLSRATAEAVKSLAQRERASPFMVLLAAFVVLLHRYSGQDDVAVGSPSANRTRRELEPVIGFFVNTLVLRTDLGGNPQLVEVLRRVRDVTLDAYSGSEVPFDRLVEELDGERDLSSNPLVQVFFSSRLPAGKLQLCGLRVTAVQPEVQTSRFDLECYVGSDNGVLAVHMVYATDLFEGSTIARMLGHYARVIEQMVTAPELRLDEFQLASDAEIAGLLELSRGAMTGPTGMTVLAMFAEHAGRAPDEPAVSHAGRQLTYRELDSASKRLAQRLVALGVKPGTPIGVLLERSVEMVVSWLAVLKAGGAYLPLDPGYPDERLLFMLSDSTAPVLVTTSRMAGRADGYSRRLIRIDVASEDSNAGAVSPALPSVDGTDLAYLIYTSGSTGRPKGVAVEHAALANLVNWHQRVYAVRADDRATQLAGLSFDAAVWEVWPYLCAGASVHLVDDDIRSDPPALLEWLDTRRITLCFLPTPLAEALLRLRMPSGLSLRSLLVGGDRLHGAAVPQGLAFPLINHYGPTEAAVVSSFAEVDPQAAQQGNPPIGRPVDNVELHVMDQQLQLVPRGVIGELFVGGASLARGYWLRDDLTAERFVDDPVTPGRRLYRTGDLVRWRSDGQLEFVGRRDEQVKLRGFRIEPAEIETVLTAHHGVQEAAVMCREDRPGEQRLVAYVVTEGSGSPTLDALRDHLRRRLPAHMVPVSWVGLSGLPLTANGKVDKRALPEPEAAGGDAGGFLEPSGDIEERIAAIWSGLLGIERVGAGDNFFDLGGHSLLVTRLVSRVREGLGVELPLRTVFATPTVRSMAALVREALAGDGAAGPASMPIPRRRDPGRAALSFAQKRMWFLSHLDVAAEAYKVIVPLRLQGPLDIGRLERAFQGLVRRHEVLRTTFGMQDGEVVQLIHAAGPFELSVEEAPDDDACRDEVVAGWLSDIRRAGFDLERGPLVHAALLRCSPVVHVLAIAMHHIVTDGWSTDILLRELDTLYTGDGNADGVLGPLPIQYADFAEWQTGLVGGELLAPQLDYWRGQLSRLTALDLPTDRPRTASQTFTGARRQIRLDDTLVKRLEQLGRDEGATLFMTMLAAFVLMLHRYTDQDDIVLGSPIANRNRAEVERLIGFFVNMLVIRVDAGGSPTFRQLLGRARDVALAAYANQDVPFEMLVDELAPVRDVSRNPMFQVLFLLQRAANSVPAIGDLGVSPVPSRVESTRFDLECHVWQRDDAVEVNIVYNVQLFDDASIERMLGHYRRLLEGAALDADRPIGQIDMLGEQERRHLLVELNDNVLEFPRDRTVHQWFEEQVARTPDAIAVRDRETALSYAELNGRAEALAARLRELGAGPEIMVGLCLQRMVRLVVGLLGILKSGAAYVPLDPQYPRERIEFMLDDASVPLLVTQSDLRDRFDGRKLDLVCVDEPLGAVRPATARPPGAGNLAYVLYTSGSTGRPKGVAIEHRSASALIAWAANSFSAQEFSGVLASTSVCFDLSVFEIFCPLATGGSVVVVENLFELPSLPFREEVSLINSVPSVMRELLRGDAIPSSVITVNLAGEPLAASLVDQIYRVSEVERIYDLYGPSEDTTYSTWTLRRQGAPATIGRPISNTSVYLIDRYGQPVPKGLAGELCVAGSGLAREYLNRPELTAEKFVPNPFVQASNARMYRTGDRARYFPDGQIEYLGRVDQQVKLRGFRIELGEIEATLVAHPSVRECVVICREDEPGDARLVAYMVASGEGELAPGELRAHVAARLPGFMMPAAFVQLDAIPLTPNGKIDRLRLPAPDGARRVDDAYVAPRTELEARISRLWCEVLRVDRVGVHDNFFDLGGSSLLIVKLRARIVEEMGVDVTVVELFTHPTVRQVAAHLDGGDAREVDRDAAMRRARMRRASSARRGLRAPRPASAVADSVDNDEDGNGH